jgi:micrococcal nuclease
VTKQKAKTPPSSYRIGAVAHPTVLRSHSSTKLQSHGHDKVTRTIGNVILPDGMNLKQELVKQGWCWWYRQYALSDVELEKLEKTAREGTKGLWADRQAVTLWEWRMRSGRATRHLATNNHPISCAHVCARQAS